MPLYPHYTLHTTHYYTGQVATVELAMDEQPFIMDIKLDGERLAIHIDNTLVSTSSGGSSGGNSGSSGSGKW